MKYSYNSLSDQILRQAIVETMPKSQSVIDTESKHILQQKNVRLIEIDPEYNWKKTSNINHMEKEVFVLEIEECFYSPKKEM